MTPLLSFLLFLFTLIVVCFGPMVLKKIIKPKNGLRYDDISVKFALCGVAVSLVLYLYFLHG